MANKYGQKVTLSRLCAVSRDIAYFATFPDNQELGTPFTALCQFDNGHWSYETFSMALADMTLFKASGQKHRVLQLLFETGVVVNLHTKSQEIILPANSPIRRKYRLGLMLKIKQIGSHLYVAGDGGQIYIRQDENKWELLNAELLDGPDQMLSPISPLFQETSKFLMNTNPTPEDVDNFNRLSLSNRSKMLWGITGFSSTNIYACSEPAAIYYYDGGAFRSIPQNSDQALLAIYAHEDGRIWVGGRRGTILAGDHVSGFQRIAGVTGEPNFSTMTYFAGKLYLGSYANPRGLFVLDGGVVTRVFSGLKPEISDVSMIEATEDVLWVMGSKDIVRFDGRTWERLDFPDNDPIR